MATIIESNEEVLLKSLLRFYKTDPQYPKMLAAVAGQDTIISLREMDFLVTKYSKKKNISYNVNGLPFNIYLSYKAQLKGHSKKKFDPFCRIGDKTDTSRLGRLFLKFDGTEIESIGDKTKDELNEYRKRTDGIVTNVGQMNFFKWAILNKVIDYCFKNKKDIVEAMEEEYRMK